MKKIAIVGNSGSGKTTLALQLHEKFNLPVYHIDQYYWGKNWQRPDPEEFKKVYGGLCEKDTWIIEGAYIKGFAQRAQLADIVIFLDVPRFVCLKRVLKRTLFHWGTERPDSPKGCKEAFFARKYLEFLKWVWDFDKKHRAAILGVINECSDKKPTYILKSHKEISDFVSNVKA